jgi:hypothetical protein
MVCLCSFTAGDYTLLNSIPFKNLSFLTTDNLGNVYVIAENQLLQYDMTGKPLRYYSVTNLGELRSVDASNPMKIGLFYPDFAKVILLNNKLAEQSTIDLRSVGMVQPTLFCNSMFDGYWVYDLQDFQLKKIDLNLQVVSQSGDLSKMQGYALLPNFLMEEDGKVYLNDPKSGILVFDRYGTYYKTIPLKGLHDFQIFQNELLYVQNDSLRSFHLKTIQQRTILLPVSDSLRMARFGTQQLYLLTKGSLNFYSF